MGHYGPKIEYFEKKKLWNFNQTQIVTKIKIAFQKKIAKNIEILAHSGGYQFS